MIIISLLIKIIKNLLECLAYKPTTRFFNIKNFYIKFGGEVLKEDEIDCYLQMTKHNYENIFLKIYSTELQAYINNNLIL
jgi:hypothetical protein